jgi:hypothetical protein
MTDLDEVLERFHRTALEYGGGLTNHGPMVAEAIVALGHGALLTGWLDLYAPRLPVFEPGRPLSGAEREAALGDSSRMSDWVATWEQELSSRDWRVLLREELPRLAPGFFASATHGWLRVAHAVRALLREETPVRRRELAFGLGLWSASFHALPGTPGAHPRRSPAEVLAELEPVPSERRVDGLFDDAVRALDAHPSFAESIECVDLAGADVLELVNALCCEGARLYLAQPHARIGYAHAVTSTSAVRLLAPVLEDETLRELAGRAFQASCALHAVLARPTSDAPGPSDEARRMAEDPAEIGYRAACSLREHAIKLAEACLREDAAATNPVLRLAAADAALELEGERSWSDQA